MITTEIGFDSTEAIKPYNSYETENYTNIEKNFDVTRHVHSSRRYEGLKAKGILNKTVKKRLNGFLLRIEGEQSIVVIADGDNHYEYVIPSHTLKKAGIQYQNQPFQMDYLEMKTGSSVITAQEFKPLASIEHMTREPVELTPEQENWRKLIFESANA